MPTLLRLNIDYAAAAVAIVTTSGEDTTCTILKDAPVPPEVADDASDADKKANADAIAAARKADYWSQWLADTRDPRVKAVEALKARGITVA